MWWKVLLALTLFEAYYSQPASVNHEMETKNQADDVTVPNMAQIIEHVNNAKTTWTAGQNFPLDTPMSFYKQLTGTMLKGPNENGLDDEKCDCTDLEDLPKGATWRYTAYTCYNMHEVYNQGSCSSSWAISAASVFTDRICIKANRHTNFPVVTPVYSVQELLTCCRTCGNGCQGGYPDEAWRFMLGYGLVTGGQYNSEDAGCQPYSILPCDHTIKGSCDSPTPTPACGYGYCTNKDWQSQFKNEVHRAKTAYNICACGAIKEIFKHGPIQATFFVHEDFLNYKSGVYQYKTGKLIGSLSVQVMGWGTENGVDYWEVKNSWGSNWGDYGHFKIRRGTNECSFEDYFMAGHPF